ncbi:MAG: triose-phosphate isomerase [Clostridiales bacterium]|nr:triose-phosphate isomerase [Clostridiales bacterium]MBR0468235.1 triose-phosphate isomerase [Mogibacterium sp.]
MKKFLIAGNWKMNKTSAEAAEFAEALKAKELPNAKDVCVLAPFTLIGGLGKAFEGTGIGFGAQNVHFEPSGAFTGEISVPMLKDLGVGYCIVGHSERREYFAETDKTVNLKLKALLQAGITPILCVGESLEIREQGGEQTFVAGQVIADFDGIGTEDAAKVVIAYEPIWAIGTGKTATPDQAEEMCAFIRGVISGIYDDATGDSMLILYGGSMKPSNAKELLEKPDINGGLIGGASLKADDLAAIAEAAASL